MNSQPARDRPGNDQRTADPQPDARGRPVWDTLYLAAGLPRGRATLDISPAAPILGSGTRLQGRRPELSEGCGGLRAMLVRILGSLLLLASVGLVSCQALIHAF